MNDQNDQGMAACETLAAALVLAADDELTPAEWRVVERHLALCPACRAQWADFARMDRRLLECAAELTAGAAPDPASRVQLVGVLSSRERKGWLGWPLGKGTWRWAAASLAATLVAWILLVPGMGGFRPLVRLNSRPPDSPVALTAAGSAEVVRVNVSLAPVGNPFLDGSPAESPVLADVTVGADGQPRELKLAE